MVQNGQLNGGLRVRFQKVRFVFCRWNMFKWYGISGTRFQKRLTHHVILNRETDNWVWASDCYVFRKTNTQNKQDFENYFWHWRFRKGMTARGTAIMEHMELWFGSDSVFCIDFFIAPLRRWRLPNEGLLFIRVVQNSTCDF